MSKFGRELVLVDANLVRKAEKIVVSCEQCYRPAASIPFDWLLARVTGKQGLSHFLMEEFAHCPACRRPMTETTLVEPLD